MCFLVGIKGSTQGNKLPPRSPNFPCAPLPQWVQNSIAAPIGRFFIIPPWFIVSSPTNTAVTALRAAFLPLHSCSPSPPSASSTSFYTSLTLVSSWRLLWCWSIYMDQMLVSHSMSFEDLCSLKGLMLPKADEHHPDLPSCYARLCFSPHNMTETLQRVFQHPVFSLSTLSKICAGKEPELHTVSRITNKRTHDKSNNYGNSVRNYV